MITIVYGKMTKKGDRTVRGAWIQPGAVGPSWDMFAAARHVLTAPEGLMMQADVDGALAIVKAAKDGKCRFASAGALLGHLHGTKDIGLSRKDHAALVRLHQQGFADRWTASPSIEEEIDELAADCELVAEPAEALAMLA